MAGRRSVSVQEQEARQPEKAPVKLFQDYMDIGASLAEPEPNLDFVLPGLLAGTLGVLVSPGGAGKSMLALQAGLCVATGQNLWALFGEDVKPGRVLIVNAEDPKIILARRLHALRSSVPPVFERTDVLPNIRIKSVHGAGFSLGAWTNGQYVRSQGFDVLTEEIEEFQPRLIIWDTLNRLLSGISENDNAAIGRVMSEIEAVQAHAGAAGILLHHISKVTALGGQGDQQQAARGAGAITDNARWQMNLQTMTTEDAQARGLDEIQRKRWVRSMTTKTNYSAPIDDRWYQRGDGGVLTNNVPPAAVKAKKGRKRPVTGGSQEIGW